MFIYRNGRFSLGSASFALPDSCIVDTSLPLDSHNGLVMGRCCGQTLSHLPQRMHSEALPWPSPVMTLL